MRSFHSTKGMMMPRDGGAATAARLVARTTAAASGALSTAVFCIVASLAALAGAAPSLLAAEPKASAAPPAAGAAAPVAAAETPGGAALPPTAPAVGGSPPTEPAAPLPGPQVPPAPPAKQLFGAMTTAAQLAPRAIGAYALGCLAGARALPVDGPAWQAMRLSRNRNWGHPDLVALVERFAMEARERDGWPGLLVGDISQPRGGPMLTGHASHQIGLDADIWFTPMPDRRLSAREREDMSATSMLVADNLSVDPKVFTPAHVQLLKRAASYPQVERVLVHPAIKKAVCAAAGTDRAWLGKVRPIYGHYYHFHIRMACPAESGAGSGGCVPQKPVSGDDGCGKELDDWFKLLTRPPPPPPATPPKPRPELTLDKLPQDCRTVLEVGIAHPVENRSAERLAAEPKAAPQGKPLKRTGAGGQPVSRPPAARPAEIGAPAATGATTPRATAASGKDAARASSASDAPPARAEPSAATVPGGRSATDATGQRMEPTAGEAAAR